MSNVDLVDCEIDEAWKQKMKMLNKEQIIDLFAKELKRVKPMKKRLKKLEKYRDENEAMFRDPERLGQFLAGL